MGLKELLNLTKRSFFTIIMTIMKIAVLGTRGIPAAYSGFETCVEQVSSRLVKRGHKVTVYCRTKGVPVYKGIKLVNLPTISNKYLDTFFHTFISVLHVVIRSKTNTILIFGVGNAVFCLPLRIFKKKVIINVDGLDWKRKKWGAFARWYLKISERWAGSFANEVITDSNVIRQYYLNKYNKCTHMIAYGAYTEKSEKQDFLAKSGLKTNGYILFVGRLVPENCAHHLIKAYNLLNTKLKLVVVGGGSYSDKYMRYLKSEANPNTLFTGYVFGEDYRQIVSNAYVFVESSEVGGTHPALLEAMGMGNCVMVNDIPPNLETIGNAGLSYKGNKEHLDLAEKLDNLIGNPDIVEKYRKLAMKRIKKFYSWELVADKYEELINECD